MHAIAYLSAAIVFATASAFCLHLERKSRLWYPDRLLHGLAWSFGTLAMASLLKSLWLLVAY